MQEYYGLDLDREIRRGFLRPARLFMQLPTTARVMEKLNPVRDWNFDRETQSQILRRLDVISDQLAKFGSKKKIDTPKPFEPEYVTKGKKKLAERAKEEKRWSEADKNKLAEYFAKHNAKVKRIE